MTTQQDAVDIARHEVREAFYRVAGQIPDYEVGIRAWAYVLTEALETTITVVKAIRDGTASADPTTLKAALKKLADARARYLRGEPA